jgi:hypothetical protein
LLDASREDGRKNTSFNWYADNAWASSWR